MVLLFAIRCMECLRRLAILMELLTAAKLGLVFRLRSIHGLRAPFRTHLPLYALTTWRKKCMNRLTPVPHGIKYPEYPATMRYPAVDSLEDAESMFRQAKVS